MKHKILRTPLNPNITFSDDPLRILRVLRFKSVLGFKLCDELYDSLKKKIGFDLLKTKVSSERITTEVFKLINGMFWYETFICMYEIKIFEYILYYDRRIILDIDILTPIKILKLLFENKAYDVLHPWKFKMVSQIPYFDYFI